MLTDQFKRLHTYLRISLTDKCNLRCTYCNPIDLPKGYFSHSNKMSADEIDTIAGVFVSQGINKIRLTGGEPLVRKDAKEIILQLAKYPVELAITTNGVFVHEYIDTFRQAGIRSVNVSLDSLNPKRNHLITGRDEFDRVKQNINLLLKNNFQVKINIVIMADVNAREIPDFVAWTKEQPFAIISTMSRPFCSGCNRLRLTTDGKMKNCLFSRSEVDILGALRNGSDILPLIKKCVSDKEESLGGQFTSIDKNFDLSKITNRSMINIGG